MKHENILSPFHRYDHVRLRKKSPIVPENLLEPDLLLDTYRHKCPPTHFLGQNWCFLDKLERNLLLSDIAKQHDMLDLSFRLKHCCWDALLYRSPSGKIGHTLLGCANRLCPVCHERRARELRHRLRSVIENGKIFVTLTMRTIHDYNLKNYVRTLRSALRLLTQKKKSTTWTPFREGYFWRLELTPGKGFHPHLHLIVDSDFIDYHQLKARWGSALARYGGEGNFIYLSRVNERSLYEVAKYLSKDLFFFHPDRWPYLDEGLKKIRTFGSGGSLKLPKKLKKGYKKICFASELTEFSDYELLRYNKQSEMWRDLSQGCTGWKRVKNLSDNYTAPFWE